MPQKQQPSKVAKKWRNIPLIDRQICSLLKVVTNEAVLPLNHALAALNKIYWAYLLVEVQLFRWPFFLCTFSNVEYKDLRATLNPYSNSKILKIKNYPPASEASREVANLTERKNPRTPVYGVKEFVCLSVCDKQNGQKKIRT